VETQLIVAKELGFLDDERFTQVIGLVDEVLRMLGGLSRSLS
jgi:hypothetical protein